ncbi:hypothetical protein JAAARDRAFT_405660 [Jaapia argillacea MUCL 33604]|uniref:G-protein coupled receptors family 1 profile domain-containing protein n=1 Tax=Jaapia argillacea MUCL 33604 TaxID=933084 RepID=A0A067PHF2_9AGAM|nr:hypothetical protein JAAARDRAFT_405660 [Jaapia argillacea MUCL 33604]
MMQPAVTRRCDDGFTPHRLLIKEPSPATSSWILSLSDFAFAKRPNFIIMCGERSYHASFTTMWAEALLFGLYIPLFLGCAYICVYTRPNKYLLAMATTMFVLCTANVLLDFATALFTPEIVANTVCTGGVCFGCDGETESRVNQINIQTILWMIADTVNVVTQLMADGLLIHRTFVLWKSRIWVIVIPIATLVGTTVCGLFQTSVMSKIYYIRLHAPLDETTPPPEWMILTDLQSTLSAIQGALIITTNVLTTVLIVSRIWWITRGFHRTLGRRATRKYRQVVKAIVESGGVYTMWIVIRVAFIYIYPDDFSNVPAAIVNQLTGITPTLLIIMLGLGKSIDHTAFRYPNLISMNTFHPVSEPLEVGSAVPLSNCNHVLN